MAGKAHGGNFQLSSTVQNRPTGMAVDAAGNMMSYLGASYVFDQENRISTVAGTSYIYDGGGQRVLKSNSSTGAALKRYWSGGGNILAEGDGLGNLTAEYVYFGGQRVARIDLPANTVHYYLSDHLNSTSMVVSSTGTIEEESDYSSFGNEYVVTGSGANHFKFTGKERDSETGLDYFGARYYANGMGRWISADWSATPVPVPYVDFQDPQTLNLYGYVRGLPITKADRDGHGWWAKFKNSMGDAGCWCEGEKAQQAIKANQEKREANEAAMQTAIHDPKVLQNAFIMFLAVLGETIPSGASGSASGAEAEAAAESGASSAANGARLRGQLTAEEIASGHAFDKHVLQQGEFPGVTTREQFSGLIEKAINNASEVRTLSNGRTAYWDSTSGTVVIRNPGAADGGTAFKPTQGKTYFDNLK